MSLLSPAWRPGRASVHRRAAHRRRMTAATPVTEHDVAVSQPPAAPAVAASHRLAGFGRTVTAWTAPRPHVLRREPAYLEAARMAREMGRL